uniref:Uncharacterized protein n=1 Tax=Ascaris lumbricoides TaxID=6252 RepID=A0A0M3IA74_ASCLU
MAQMSDAAYLHETERNASQPNYAPRIHVDMVNHAALLTIPENEEESSPAEQLSYAIERLVIKRGSQTILSWLVSQLHGTGHHIDATETVRRLQRYLSGGIATTDLSSNSRDCSFPIEL